MNKGVVSEAMEEITPVLGGLALQSVMEMPWQGAVMFNDDA